MVLKLSLAPQLTPQPISTAVEAATRYRELALDLKDAKAALAIARDEILAVAEVTRQAQIMAGDPITSVDLATSDGATVQIVHQERYKALPSKNVPELRAAFGERYDLLCVETEAVSLKAGVTIDSLKAALGAEAFAILEQRISVKRTVTARKGATAHLAAAYAGDQHEEAANLALLIDATLCSPQVRVR